MQDCPLILCIDDETVHAEIRALLLRHFGCEVIVKSTPDECLAAVLARHFDLAILDFHLADGVLGDALARRLRAQHPTLPLLLLTGDFRIPEQARHSVDAVLIKGACSPAELWETIQALLPQGKLLKKQPARAVPGPSRRAS